MRRPSQNQPQPSLLRISGTVSARSRKLLITTWIGLPLEASSPVQVAFLPELTAYRGQLLSGSNRGTPVYAASFIRQRRIVLETALLSNPAVLRFIFVHELFHFAWLRLGNARRNQYSCLLSSEIKAKARGELGESSAVKKSEFLAARNLATSSRIWRDYLCESFCDSAASIFTEGPLHEGSKLGKTWTALRREWFLPNSPRVFRWAV